ncbi:hypothetical protein PPYR_01882 [Photinus pyralis]|uniref:DUF4806 domain-containing protein n=1 Tax=Photinus pyralis TaxID=7054 RepID=A0A5N4B5N0_PHOPY|nr:hypothetical protein PPYR_01882 [Photinus pyralis]
MYLPFCVVGFILDGEEYISAAPTKWLQMYEDTFKCAWPPQKLEKKAILHAASPEDDWTIYDNVQLYGKYLTYKEARYRELKIASYESESDQATRKRKPNKKYVDNEIPSPPSLPSLYVVNEIEDDFAENTQNTESDATSEPSSSSHIEAVVPDLNDEIPIVFDILEEPTILAPDKCGMSDFEKTLLVHIEEIKATLEVMSLRLRHVEICLELRANTDRIESNMFTELPCKSLEDVQNLEKKLQDDKALQNLITMLKYIGGANGKSCTSNCLKKIFSNLVGQFCSWTGQKGNFKLADLRLMIAVNGRV